MLNLHHLEVFHAVAEAGSVTGGADRLGVSQPAVSKQVRLLERAVGTPLVERHGRGVRLTAAGAALADHARRAFAIVAEAEMAVADVAGVRRGSLAVAAGPTVGVYLLPRAVVAFRQAHPGVRLAVETLPAGAVRQRLLDGAVELAVTEADVRGSGLTATVLLRDTLVPVVPPGHPLASRKQPVTAAEFCREPFVVRETVTGEPSLTERTLAGRGLMVRPAMTVGSTEAIKQAVMAGVGVALVSRLAVAAEAAAGLLAVAAVRGLAIRYPIYHVRRRDRRPTSAAAAFAALLADRPRGTTGAKLDDVEILTGPSSATYC